MYLFFYFGVNFLDYENYYPKDKKEIPKANENNESDSKGTLIYYAFFSNLFDKKGGKKKQDLNPTIVMS